MSPHLIHADGRLRDLSSDNEKESKSKISDLEKELSTLGDAQSRLELSEAKLANAETQVEDLKLQLDDALGAEDLLEQLTERNLQMSEVSLLFQCVRRLAYEAAYRGDETDYRRS
jgi:uncharacterized protein YPO0396